MPNFAASDAFYEMPYDATAFRVEADAAAT